MKSKNIILILIAIIILIAGAIVTDLYLMDMMFPQVPEMKTVETKAFKFNTTLDDNWTFYKDHDDGYSYKNDAINQSKIRYYTGSIDDIFSQIAYVGWKQIDNENLTSDAYLYESHFDNEVASGDSYHTYYSAFKPLSNGGYVHVSSMDLNRTITIVNAIESINTGV